MVQAVLVILGLFIIFGVTCNVLYLRKRKLKPAKNTLFSAEPKIAEMQMSEHLPETQFEPLIDPSVKNTPIEKSPKKMHLQSQESTLVSIHLICSPKGDFLSPYELIQALSDANCHYGEMSIFHRHEQANGEGSIVFSIAQAVNPGRFNMDDIGSTQCPGLVLFMDAAMMDDPYFTFNLMLETAEQLAEALHADLYETPTQPMTQSSQAYYEHQLKYAKAERERLKEMV